MHTPITYALGILLAILLYLLVWGGLVCNNTNPLTSWVYKLNWCIAKNEP